MRCHCLFDMQFFLNLGYGKLLPVFKQINDHDPEGMRNGPEEFAHFLELLYSKCFRLNIGHEVYFLTISVSIGLFQSKLAIISGIAFALVQKSYKKRLSVNPLAKILFTNCIELSYCTKF